MVTSSNPDPQLMSDWLAGLVRFVERVPSLANSKASLYTLAGPACQLPVLNNSQEQSQAANLSAMVPDGAMRVPPFVKRLHRHDGHCIQ